ncbi:MAG: helix-turn-helix domain-containing protein [Candidatus Limnocylindria bacterium]
MPRHTPRDRTLERIVQHRLRRQRRSLGDDLARLRTEAGATRAAVAAAAGLDRTFYGRVEAALATPGLETLIAVAAALGAEVSVRIYAGSGPRLTDRHQARMVEALLGTLCSVWRPHLEVAVWRPVRGVVDMVLDRVDQPLLVVGEFESNLGRLEQQLRWSAEKAAAIGSSDVVRDGPVPPVSRMLVVRSSAANREIVRRFERTVRASYPARTEDAVRSLRDGTPWPGDAIVWVRIDGDEVSLMDGPPRGVAVGR